MPAARKTAAQAVGAKPARKAARPPLRDVSKTSASSPTADEAVLPHLRPTAEPGVFLNPAGARVNKDGILLTAITQPAESEEELAERILGGPADTPAKVLKLMALNTALPITLRLDAAAKAAPYFDKKVPVAVETETENKELDMVAIAKLPREKRMALLATLKELGVNLGGEDR